MTAMKYLQHSVINQRLIDEKERIAKRLKDLDEVEMPKFVMKTGDRVWKKWKPVGLEGKWNSFIKKRAQTARDKAIRLMEDKLKDLEEAYVTDYNKEMATHPNPESQALGVLIRKIESLRAEWTRYKPISWTNPF